MKLSSKQGDYYKHSNAKINIAHGSVRSGKTFISNLRWLKYVKNEAPKGKLLMSGVTGETLKENVLDDIELMVGRGNYVPPKKGGIAHLYGRHLEIRGAEKIDSEKRIRGRTYSGWYADEITLHHPAFTKQAITRCSPKGSRIFWTTNPDHPKHLVKRDYIDNLAMHERGQVKDWAFYLSDNLTLSTEYKELLKASFSGVFYKRNILGQWVIAEGLVYKDFDENVHNIPYEDVQLMLKNKLFKYFIAGIDWGHSHPMACPVYGVTHNNTYVQICEYYATERRTEDLGMWLQYVEREMLGERIKWIWADSAEPDRIAVLRSHPFKLPVMKARKDKDAGLNSVMTTFKSRRLLVCIEQCPNTVMELQTYRYPDEDDPKFAKDEPLKEDDHIMDGKRYCIHNHELYLLKQMNKKDRSKRPRQAQRRSRKDLKTG